MGVSGSGSCRGEVAGCTQSVGAPGRELESSGRQRQASTGESRWTKCMDLYCTCPGISPGKTGDHYVCSSCNASSQADGAQAGVGLSLEAVLGWPGRAQDRALVPG